MWAWEQFIFYLWNVKISGAVGWICKKWGSGHVFICISNGLQSILEKCRQQLGNRANQRGLSVWRSTFWSHHLWSSSEITFDFSADVCFLRYRVSLWGLPAFWLVSWGCPALAKKKQSAKWHSSRLSTELLESIEGEIRGDEGKWLGGLTVL